MKNDADADVHVQIDTIHIITHTHTHAYIHGEKKTSVETSFNGLPYSKNHHHGITAIFSSPLFLLIQPHIITIFYFIFVASISLLATIDD